MGFKAYWGGQFGNPTGVSGKIVTFLMNRMNQPMYKTVLRNAKTDGAILDIGFGNGYMLGKLAKHSDAALFGVDISADMVVTATKRNRKATEANRLQLAKASVMDIPFDMQFDQIYTINTIYFWDDLLSGLKAVYSKLKAGGEFLNVCYTKEWLTKPGFTESYKKYAENELIEAHTQAGFKAEIVSIKQGKSFYVRAIKVG